MSALESLLQLMGQSGTTATPIALPLEEMIEGSSAGLPYTFRLRRSNSAAAHPESTERRSASRVNHDTSGDSRGSSSGVGRVYRGGLPVALWVQNEQQRATMMNIGNGNVGSPPPVLSFEAQEGERLRLQGNTAFKVGNFKEAIELYNHSIHSDPDCAFTYCNRSLAHLKLGNVVEAVADAEEAVNLNPNSYKGYFRLGAALEARGDYRRALDSYRRAAALNTANSDMEHITTSIAKCESKLKRGFAGTRLLSESSVSSSATFSDREDGPLDFNDLLVLANKALETRRQVASYRSKFEEQNGLVECRLRFKRVQELIQVATNTPFMNLLNQAKEKQSALRRMLKSERRDTYTVAKKDRDASYKELWNAADELDKAMRELERMAKEEEAFYERFGATASSAGRVEEVDGDDDEAECRSSADSRCSGSRAKDENDSEFVSKQPKPESTLGDPDRLNYLLNRRIEIEDEVHKLQQRLAVTEEAGRQFFFALLNEERMVEKLQPLLSEAMTLHDEIERQARYTARHTSKELSQKRLANLLSLREVVDEVRHDRENFISSLDEGNQLLEQEAVLERDRLALERHRIQLKGEIEWMKVCDEPQSKINQLENNVEYLQKKIEATRESQERIQKRIVKLIDGDHPELAWTSMLSGSRILRLVKGSGLWLNISLGDIEFLNEIGSTENTKSHRAVFRGETVTVRDVSIDNERALKRFRTEISMVARCRHPNVITIKGVFFEGGRAYIIFPFFPRGSLKDLGTRKEVLPSGEMQDIFRQVVSGLAYLHEQGIIHANFRPSTIFLSEPNRPVIADFGIAELGRSIAPSAYSRGSAEFFDSSSTPSMISPLGFSVERGGDPVVDKPVVECTGGNAPYSTASSTEAAVKAENHPVDCPRSPETFSSSWFLTSDMAEIQPFLAPELLSGNRHPSCASDVWGLGRTLFDVAAKNASLLDPSLGQHTMPYLLPSQTRIEISAKRVGGDEHLADMISSTLMYDPHRRPSAYELLAHPYFSVSLNSHHFNRITALLNSDERIETVRSYIRAIRREHSKVLVSVQRSQMVESVAAVFPELSEEEMVGPIMVVFQGEAGIDEGALTTEMLNLYYEQLVVKHRAVVVANEEDFEGSSDSPTSVSMEPSPTSPSTASRRAEGKERSMTPPLSSNNERTNGGAVPSFPSSSPSTAPAPNGIVTGATYLPAEDTSKIEPSVFELLGKMMLKNIVENRPLPLELNASVLKFFCNASVSILDLEEYDRTFARHLKQLRLQSDEDLRAIFLDFSNFPPDFLESQFNGIYSTTTQLQRSNVGDYIKMSVEYFLFYKRRRALEAMKKGFYHYPSLARHLKLLTPFDLQILLSGTQHINAQVIIDALEFKNFPSSSKTPMHLKEILGKMTQNNLRRFLQFCTSTAAAPVNGVMKKISVVCCSDTSRLPVGHGCVSQLDLPDYNDPKELEEKLLVALAHVTDGFHIV